MWYAHFQGVNISYPREGDNQSAVQTSWDRPTWPYWDRGSELDCTLCHNRTPRCSAPRKGRVPVRRPWPPDRGGYGGYSTSTCGGGRDGPGRGLGRHIQARRLTDGEGTAYRYVTVCAPLHLQWVGVRGTGMEGFPLPSILNWATWPAIPLQRMWNSMLNFPRTWLIKGRPHHGASQRALWWG